MADLILDLRIVFEEMRCCDCGRWWATERGFRGMCPKCAHDRLARALKEKETAERSAAATRGALAKAKGRQRRRAK